MYVGCWNGAGCTWSHRLPWASYPVTNNFDEDDNDGDEEIKTKYNLNILIVDLGKKLHRNSLKNVLITKKNRWQRFPVYRILRIHYSHVIRRASAVRKKSSAGCQAGGSWGNTYNRRTGYRKLS